MWEAMVEIPEEVLQKIPSEINKLRTKDMIKK